MQSITSLESINCSEVSYIEKHENVMVLYDKNAIQLGIIYEEDLECLQKLSLKGFVQINANQLINIGLRNIFSLERKRVYSVGEKKVLVVSRRKWYRIKSLMNP